MRKKLLIFWGPFLLVLFGVMYASIGLPWDYFQAKQAFHEHLEQYDREMVIDEVSYDFMHGVYSGHAYVKDNPDLGFYVGESIYNGKIEDGYYFERAHTMAKQLAVEVSERLFNEPDVIAVELIGLREKNLEVNVNREIKPEDQQHIIQALESNGFVVDQFYTE